MSQTYREKKGNLHMKKRKLLLSIALVLFSLQLPLHAESMEIFFGPGGGFSNENLKRTVTLSDGKIATATLANSLIHMIENVEAGGKLKVCMYSMSDYATLDVMIKIAREKGVRIKLILDAAADWSADSRGKILDRVRTARKEAREAGQFFDFQIKVVTKEAMAVRGRMKKMKDGKVIYGTMHEKFGVIYGKDNPVPYDSFCGSANISYTSDQIYAENRVLFRNRPAVARQFQEEFARLWNEYGTSVLGPCTSEVFIPVSVPADDVQVFFNGEPIDEARMTRIDKVLLGLVRLVRPEGSLDVAMFSLTSSELAAALIKCAVRNPQARFRIMLDQSQVDDSNKMMSLQGPWMERESKRLGLHNFEISYKWLSNAYGWNPESANFEYLSFKGLFLHHKVVVLNGEIIAFGSYNWSSAAESLNLENLMIFNRFIPDHHLVIDRFLNEFETIWNSSRPTGKISAPLRGVPQTVSGPEGRALQSLILSIVRDERNLQILQTMDRGAFQTFEQIAKTVKLPESDLRSRIERLLRNSLLCKTTKDGQEGYVQAD